MEAPATKVLKSSIFLSDWSENQNLVGDVDVDVEAPSSTPMGVHSKNSFQILHEDEDDDKDKDNDIKLKQCKRCKQVWYCKRECQIQHWKAVHKKYCIDVESK